MSNTKIEVGDYVDVFFTSSDALINGRVLYTPQDTGDSWRLVGDDGTLYYVQIFEKMIRVARGGMNVQG
jgi:hypothetical protein